MRGLSCGWKFSCGGRWYACSSNGSSKRHAIAGKGACGSACIMLFRAASKASSSVVIAGGHFCSSSSWEICMVTVGNSHKRLALYDKVLYAS